MKKLRIYIDNSVVGGCFDEEFAEGSNALMQMARDGKVTLVVSDILLFEVESAPDHVREVLDSIPESAIERVTTSPEMERLQASYLEASVVSEKAGRDALHVAIGTVSGADVIASWNFQHMVKLTRIRGFNAVNMREGYGQIEIRSPEEVI